MWNTVAFVPTMGSLHSGHLALVAEAKKRATHVVVSIYVNPSQFAPGEDFSEYPRHFESDLLKLAPYQVDAVFAPRDLYASPRRAAPLAAKQGEGPVRDTGPHQTWVRCVDLERPLCGQSRPHFFKGVATVVAKLFHIVEPDVAVFGRKDFQQLRVVETMVRELDFPIQVVGLPVVREQDGLAMSSRNALLGREGRARATCIPRALRRIACDLRAMAAQAEAEAEAQGKAQGKAEAQRPGLDAAEAKGRVAGEVEAGGGRVDYVSVVDPQDLGEIEGDLVAWCLARRQEKAELEAPGASDGSGSGAILVAVAAFFGTVRLIDNVLIEP